MNFIKSVGIYQLFILQFAVIFAEGNSSEGSKQVTLDNIQEKVTKKAEEFWNFIQQSLCEICSYFGPEGDTCKKEIIIIPVTIVLFLLLFSLIGPICCKCCCKKKENDESDESVVDYNYSIIGPDGQMYSTMYQEQMMQPQMFSEGMMYPQMYQGQMYYPQMLQEGMLQPEMYNMEMQQPVTQETGKKRKKKKKNVYLNTQILMMTRFI